MKQEERLEELLLEKDFQNLSSEELLFVKESGWSKADYELERQLRVGLKHWATAPVPTPQFKPNFASPTHPNPNPNPNPFPKFTIAAAWLLSLAIAAFIGFQSAKNQPIEVIEKVIYQTDTLYIDRHSIPLAAVETPPPSQKKIKATSPPPLIKKDAPPLAFRDTTSTSNKTYTSRNMAADKDIMKLTSRVW